MDSRSAHSVTLKLRPLSGLTPFSPSSYRLFSLPRKDTSFAFNHFRTLLHEYDNNQLKPPAFTYSCALFAKSDFLTPFLPCSSALFAKTWGVGGRQVFFPSHAQSLILFPASHCANPRPATLPIRVNSSPVLPLDLGLDFDPAREAEFFSLLPPHPAVCLIEPTDPKAAPFLIRSANLQ